MSFERVAIEEFKEHLSSATELSSVAIGGRVVEVSDEFFAEAFHLLLVEPAPSMKGQFGPKGALFNGWETRRHNPTHDWCIIQLGTPGHIYGFDIDTSHFSGNEAPEASVEVLYGAAEENPRVDDKRWSEVLPKASLGPSSRHLFKIPPTDNVNFVKLNIYPDGGVARFRVYGDVAPVHAADATPFDLAHVFAGGRVVYVSDQHFGVGSNLILPGRGKDMGDGWETKRSRTKGHKDWVIIKLQHYLQLENVENTVFTHVKMTIYPDGGVKRIRVIGLKADSVVAPSLDAVAAEDASTPLSISPSTVPPTPQVIQGYSDLTAAPKGTKITPANAGTANKFHKLTLLSSNYPSSSNATAGISVYRCQPLADISPDGLSTLTVLERHPYTNQAFVPMGKGGAEGLKETSDRYLVVVAHNGADDKPDLKTLRAFWASTAQGIVYSAGLWHQPMTVLGKVSLCLYCDSRGALIVLRRWTWPVWRHKLEMAVQQTAKSWSSTRLSTYLNCDWEGWYRELDVPRVGREYVMRQGTAENGPPSFFLTVSPFPPNAMNELSRKRPHTDDGDITVAKKRVLTGTNGTPHVNGHSDQTEDEQLFHANLEKFRKEAIFRRMKHYHRENERNLARIEELERRKTTCEAGLAAISACWSQLIESIRLFVKSDDLTPSSIQAKDVFDVAARVEEESFPELQDALGKTANATEALVHKLIESGGSDQSLSFKSSHFVELQQSQTETPSHTASPAPESAPSQDTLLPESIKIWENRIAELEAEVANLKQELRERPTKEGHQTPSLPSHDQFLKKLNETAFYQVDKMTEELNQLRASREEWEKSVIAAQAKHLEDLKVTMSKRDLENARLRQQREQANGELLERRQQDAHKWTALQEFKTLAENQSDRLEVMRSELSRCKARLAAQEREEDLLHFFLKGSPDEADLLAELRTQHREALERAQAAEAALSNCSTSSGQDPADTAKALVDAELRFVRLSKELDELKKTFGESCSTALPVDVAKLMEQVRAQGEELEKLRLLVATYERSESEIYKELSSLSTAWEGLEKQVKSKAFELYHIEEKLLRTFNEKAKSENKYFALIREREAVDGERKNLQRVNEKQQKLLEHATEQIIKLKSRVASLDKEITDERRLRKQNLESLDQGLRERHGLEAQLNEAKSKWAHVSFHDTFEFDKDRTSHQRDAKNMRQNEEAWLKQKRALEEQIQRLRQEAATKAVHDHSSSKDDSEYQLLRSLLLCSTCESNFRAVIITKCMHTFCKPCVDARIATRQRKCPACAVPFAQSDVSTLFLQ
ncbi:hypothetical protein MD484_g2643, partial [Candolleomyces efflorescens]